MRIENDGSVERVADLAPFGTHPWNDIVVDGRGNAYINNLGFRYPAEEYSPGSIVMVGGDGSIKHVADGLAFPNGMAVTPDNTTLIVAESYGKRLAAFDIEADGSLSNRRTWADVEGHPDGICLDASGAVWYADVPNQRCVRVMEGGKVLDVVELDQGCFACMLGGQDRRNLFMLTNQWNDDGVSEPSGRDLSIEASVPGVGWP